jgi:hypothetical protein
MLQPTFTVRIYLRSFSTARSEFSRKMQWQVSDEVEMSGSSDLCLVMCYSGTHCWVEEPRTVRTTTVWVAEFAPVIWTKQF